MKKFSFTPEDGLRNSMDFPDPHSEDDTREQFQRPHDQTKQFINNMIDILASDTGASEIGNSSLGDIPSGTVQSQLQALNNTKIKSSNIKAFRKTDDNIEYSLDGTNYQNIPSSGHQILNGLGNTMPQRSGLKFVDVQVTDTPGATVIQGIVGAPGKDGVGFTVKGTYDTYQDLTTAHPTGILGDIYLVGTTEKYMYGWTENNQWTNLGKMEGAKGDTGEGMPTGGTTGQVPSKASSQDYDFTWKDVYSQTEVDTALQGKVNTSTYTTDIGNINTALGTKANVSVTNGHDTRITALEGKINSSIDTYTLLASGWNNNIYELTVTGVTTTSNQEILPLKLTRPTPTQAELDNNQALMSANLQDAGQSANTIYIYAETVPTTDIQVRIIKRGVK